MNSHIKTFFVILAGIALISVWFVGDWFGEAPPQGGTYCTMDAKLCPDGSAVGRVGPRCEFAPCPGEGGGSGILPYDSGITGIVVRGPMCPVVPADANGACDDAPYATLVSVARAATPSSTFASMETRADGRFEFNLPPGSYVLDARNDGISRTCNAMLVEVGPGEMEVATLHCDTGIR